MQFSVSSGVTGSSGVPTQFSQRIQGNIIDKTAPDFLVDSAAAIVWFPKAP